MGGLARQLRDKDDDGLNGRGNGENGETEENTKQQ